MEPLFGPEDLLRPGAVAGDYVVRAMLGAGGCASVYEATQWRRNPVDQYLFTLALNQVEGEKPPLPESAIFPLNTHPVDPANPPLLAFEDIAPKLGIHHLNGNGTAASGKSSSSNRTGTLSRGGAVRKDSRAETRTSRGNRTPALTAGAKAGNSKRYGFTARAKHGTNKRG